MRQRDYRLGKIAKGVALATILSGGALDALAGFQGHQPGPVMTLGKTTNPNTLLSLGNNPASGELLISDDESFRMGYFSSFGFGMEFGDLNNVQDDIEELEELLEEDEDNPMTLDRALDAKAKFDELLPVLGEKMNFALDIGLHIPLFPIAIRSDFLGGVLGFDVRTSLLTDVRFLDAPLDIRSSGGDVELRTDSALYVKAANLVAGSLGYSREIWAPPAFDSKIFAGVNINAYHASLNKQVLSFEAIADDDDDMGEVVADEFEENLGSTSAVGVDLGFIWAFPNAQVGVTFANLNEPEFEYGEIGTNCHTLESESTRQKNCQAAVAFADEIALKETAVLNAQTTVEGAIFSEDRMFLVSGAYDLNSAYNLVGRESQMVSASISFFPNSYIIPTIRLGAERNLVGSELTKVGLGTTLFGMLNIDLSASLDTIEADGTQVPRYVGLNIGIEEKF